MVNTARPTRQQLLNEITDVAHDIPVFLTAPMYRRWHLRWGATAHETTMPLPGDDLQPRARYRTTRAITIQAQSLRDEARQPADAPRRNPPP